jgi:hypothetical protein
MHIPIEMRECLCAMIRQYVREALTAFGQQGAVYVFRPEVPEVPDFTLAGGDFTTDGNWHTLELGGILPGVGCCVRLFAQVEDNLPSDLFFRRPDGAGAEAEVQAISAGRPNGLEFSVNLNGTTRVEYMASNTVWTTIELTVIGWFVRPTP